MDDNMPICVGETVECVWNGLVEDLLTVGQLYIVTECTLPGHLFVDGNTGLNCAFRDDRFKRYIEPPQTGIPGLLDF